MATEIPDVVGGETITALHMNQVKNRTVMVYVDAAARDVAIPVPVVGDYAMLASAGSALPLITMWDGASWVVTGAAPSVSTAGSSGTLVTFPSAQTVQSTQLTYSGLWQIWCSLYLEVSTVVDTVFDIELRDVSATLQGEASVLHRGSLANDGRYPVAFSAEYSGTAGDSVILSVTRGDNSGTQLWRQAKIVARLVR